MAAASCWHALTHLCDPSQCAVAVESDLVHYVHQRQTTATVSAGQDLTWNRENELSAPALPTLVPIKETVTTCVRSRPPWPPATGARLTRPGSTFDVYPSTCRLKFEVVNTSGLVLTRCPPPLPLQKVVSATPMRTD